MFKAYVQMYLGIKKLQSNLSQLFYYLNYFSLLVDN